MQGGKQQPEAGRVLWVIQHGYVRRWKIANLMTRSTKGYWSTLHRRLGTDLMKKSIHKKWKLDWFIEEASERENIYQQVGDMKDDYKISKVRSQASNGKEKKRYGTEKLSLLWESRTPPSRPKLPSLWTGVCKVRQVQPLCFRLLSRTNSTCTTGETFRDNTQGMNQETNKGWEVK